MIKCLPLARPLASVALAVALLLGASPDRAAATPPDSVSIEDTVIGANATHLFVLRQTADNLGSHYEYRGEIWLVAIAAADGSEEYWPVYGISATTDFSEAEDRRVSSADDMATMVNPFAIMAEREAAPANNRVSTEDEAFLEARNDGRAIAIGKHTIDVAEALGRMRLSVAALAKRVADPPRMASVSTAEIYGLKTFEPELCSFEAEGWPIRPADGSPSWQPVRVTCEDPDVMDTTSLIQIARPTEPSGEED